MPSRSKPLQRRSNRVVSITRSPPAERAAPAGRTKHAFLGGIALVAITWIVYAQVGQFQFVNYDDDDYVALNEHVQNGLSWGTIRWATTSLDAANWHPLTWISHSLDWELFADRPAGHHFSSVLFHSLNVLILFLGLAHVTGRAGRSFVVAALFAVHPINVESVVWVSERKNVLCTFFFLLALIAYGWYARKPGVRRYLAVLMLFTFGLMSKPYLRLGLLLYHSGRPADGLMACRRALAIQPDSRLIESVIRNPSTEK